MSLVLASPYGIFVEFLSTIAYLSEYHYAQIAIGRGSSPYLVPLTKIQDSGLTERLVT
jgi:hypothetical protein